MNAGTHLIEPHCSSGCSGEAWPRLDSPLSTRTGEEKGFGLVFKLVPEVFLQTPA